MFDVAPAFQTTRRKMARSRKPTPLHSRSRRVWQTSLTSAFVHGRVLTKFPICSFHFASDDFGVQTRSMISKKLSTEKHCIKLLSLFLLVVGYTCEILARFGDSLALHHSGDQEKEPEYSILRRIPDLYPQFQGAFVTFTLTSRRRLSIAQW